MSHILLAEDDDSMRQFLVLALTRAGHRITACATGTDALKLVQDKGAEFDMLLADIVMPGLDGIELSQKATALFPGLKVMFITGFAAVAMGQRSKNGLKNGSQPGLPVAPDATQPRILSKPFHLNDLVKQVEDLLAGPQNSEV